MGHHFNTSLVSVLYAFVKLYFIQNTSKGVTFHSHPFLPGPPFIPAAQDCPYAKLIFIDDILTAVSHVQKDWLAAVWCVSCHQVTVTLFINRFVALRLIATSVNQRDLVFKYLINQHNHRSDAIYFS